MKFTEEQLNEIEKCKPNTCNNTFGRKGDLTWGFDGNKIYIDVEYKSKNIDGTNEINRYSNVSFDELIEIIKHPYHIFDIHCC